VTRNVNQTEDMLVHLLTDHMYPEFRSVYVSLYHLHMEAIIVAQGELAKATRPIRPFICF
jgi:hypothetical protein